MYFNKEQLLPLLSDAFSITGITFSLKVPTLHFRPCRYYLSIDDHRFDVRIISTETDLFIQPILYDFPKSYLPHMQEALDVFQHCYQTEAEAQPRLRLAVLTGTFRITIANGKEN